MRALLVLLVLAGLGCRRPDPGPSPSASPSASAPPSLSSSSSSLLPLPPPPSAAAHVAVLEKVAAVYKKKLPCRDQAAALAPLKLEMTTLGDVADPRLGAAIEADPALRARRTQALEAIMDGAMLCPGDAG